jgi:hypothetical protein
MTTRRRSALQNLEGYSFPVLFSTGAEGRADQISARLERAHGYLREVLRFDPQLRLLVLTREDWADHASFPLYGMPHSDGGRIFIGTEPADFWRGAVGMLDGALTRDQRAEIESVYGTADGRIDMNAFADLIAVHELGHLFHEQVPFAFPRLWLMELFANFCVHAYVAEREPDRVPLWTTLPDRITALPANKVRYRSLDDFERLYVGVGPENYCWYQFGLVVAARNIYDAGGTEALQRMYRTFLDHENELTDRHLAKLLKEQVHPTVGRVMETWPE